MEIGNSLDAEAIVRNKNRNLLKGRPAGVRKSSYDELMDRIFPLRDRVKNPGSENEGSMIYLRREEINSILLVCKQYKVSEGDDG